MTYRDDVKKIYNTDYVEKYPSLHILPVERKHKKNITNIRWILKRKKGSSWLDVCCGGGWHFSNIPNKKIFEKTGIDISKEHLSAAKRDNPDSEFICNDFLDHDFKDRSFDLVSCFWGSYCYLNTKAQIGEFIRKMIHLVSKNGSLYIEVITPETVKTFPGSRYERESSSSIEILSECGMKWKYRDAGGEHKMLSLPLDNILEILRESFSNIRVDSNCCVHHVVCKNK